MAPPPLVTKILMKILHRLKLEPQERADLRALVSREHSPKQQILTGVFSEQQKGRYSSWHRPGSSPSQKHTYINIHTHIYMHTHVSIHASPYTRMYTTHT